MSLENTILDLQTIPDCLWLENDGISLKNRLISIERNTAPFLNQEPDKKLIVSEFQLAKDNKWFDPHSAWGRNLSLYGNFENLVEQIHSYIQKNVCSGKGRIYLERTDLGTVAPVHVKGYVSRKDFDPLTTIPPLESILDGKTSTSAPSLKAVAEGNSFRDFETLPVQVKPDESTNDLAVQIKREILRRITPEQIRDKVISIVFVLDHSDSMVQVGDLARKTMDLVMNELASRYYPKEIQVGVVLFNDPEKIETLLPVTKMDKDGEILLSEKFRTITLSGGTEPVGKAVLHGLQLFGEDKEARIKKLVVITDDDGLTDDKKFIPYNFDYSRTVCLKKGVGLILKNLSEGD